MELEEGEYVEEEELIVHCQPQKSKCNFIGEYHISSVLKRRREEDDYETVSMEMDSDLEISNGSKSGEQQSEDDVELLRRQLLSQVRKKKAKQQKMNEENAEIQKEVTESENVESAKRNDMKCVTEKWCQLNERLTEAQLLRSTIVRRKKRLQDELVECEADLTRSQIEISSTVEAILGLWSEAISSGLSATLFESKKEKSQQTEKNTDFKTSTQQTSLSIPQQANIDEVLVSGQLQERVTTEEGTEQQQNDITEKQHLERATTEESTEQQQNDTTEKQHQERATTEDSTEQQQDDITEKQHQERATTEESTETQQREPPAEEECVGIAAVPLPNTSLITESDHRIEGFLASIRAYRLNPRFSHRLLAHHSISNRLDPFVPLCPFQLHGRCADKNCPWQHENEYKMSEIDIVAEVIALWPSVCPQGMSPDQYATALLANDRFEMVIGYLLSIMPEEAFIIRLTPVSGVPRLASKPIPTDENIEFVSLLSTKQNMHGSSQLIC